jgi:hypothetical protein
MLAGFGVVLAATPLVFSLPVDPRRRRRVHPARYRLPRAATGRGPHT